MIQLIFSHLGTMERLIVLVAVIIPVLLCVFRAKKINRSAVIWGILGFEVLPTCQTKYCST